MSISRRPSRATACFAILALGAATPAFAQSDFIVTHDKATGSVTRTMEVDISDLRLSTAKGRTALRHRINAAARTVCDHAAMHGLKQLKDYERCYSKAMAGAMDQVKLVQTASR